MIHALCQTVCHRYVQVMHTAMPWDGSEALEALVCRRESEVHIPSRRTSRHNTTAKKMVPERQRRFAFLVDILGSLVHRGRPTGTHALHACLQVPSTPVDTHAYTQLVPGIDVHMSRTHTLVRRPFSTACVLARARPASVTAFVQLMACYPSPQFAAHACWRAAWHTMRAPSWQRTHAVIRRAFSAAC